MRAIWLSITQLSLEHDYEEKKRLSFTKEGRFSKLLSREPFWLSFFSQCMIGYMYNPVLNPEQVDFPTTLIIYEY